MVRNRWSCDNRAGRCPCYQEIEFAYSKETHTLGAEEEGRDAEKMLQPVGESIEALSRRQWELPGAKTLARVGK